MIQPLHVAVLVKAIVFAQMRGAQLHATPRVVRRGRYRPAGVDAETADGAGGRLGHGQRGAREHGGEDERINERTDHCDSLH